jgi:hypothetical protein
LPKKNKKFKESYAKELENQIKEHAQKEKVNFNEMDERSLTLNQKGLQAYETGERNTSTQQPTTSVRTSLGTPVTSR